MAILDYAIEHIRAGRQIFPGEPGEKTPARGFNDPYSFATTDEKQILRWWKQNPSYNICIPMGIEVEPGKFLGAIDVDGGLKKGHETVGQLEMMGYDFHATLEQITPSHGRHLLYYFDSPIDNGVNSLGRGIDHRGFHGYICGAGSWYHGKEYFFKNQLPISQAPGWAAERLQRRSSGARHLSVVHGIQSPSAGKRAAEFLHSQSPVREGERNQRGFEVACRLKDFGCSQQEVYDSMSTDWKCEPTIDERELEHVVASAFKYGKNSQGVDSPEAAFTKLEIVPVEKTKGPIDSLNDEYAYIVSGGSSQILHFAKDEDGFPVVNHLRVPTFHEKLANKEFTPDGGRSQPVSKYWMKWPGRRSYEGAIFAPNRPEDGKWYNKWRGFTVEPLKEAPTEKAKKALENFKDHILRNVAGGVDEHAEWIFCWMAHMFQKPEKKVRTALALRGKKGVGKSIIFKLLKSLLGTHACSVAHRRFLSGNFNGHLEDKILYGLEEAFWSGSKDVEGILKDLVTNETHMIERKGAEAYEAANLARVMIMGNDDWIVPASEEERRFAVFDVASNNMQDDNFFGSIIEDMDPRVLLGFFMDYDLTKANINQVPKTEALARQKEESLAPFKKWWVDSLHQGYLIGWTDEWPETILKESFRQAFLKEMKNLGQTKWLTDPARMGHILKEIAPSCTPGRTTSNGQRQHIYRVPTLAEARLEWEKFFGQEVDWLTEV